MTKRLKEKKLKRNFALTTILVLVILFSFLAVFTTKEDIQPFFDQSVKEKNFTVLTEMAHDIIETRNITKPAYSDVLTKYVAKVNNDETIDIHLNGPGAISVDVKLSNDFEILHINRRDETFIFVILGTMFFICVGVIINSVCFGIYFAVKWIYLKVKKP